MRDDPVWLEIEVMLNVHEEMLRRYGGAAGMRDRGLFESALSRARNLFSCGQADLFDLAAAYAFGIVCNHPFIDGNKRTEFMAAAMFLEVNGRSFSASPAEAAVMALGLADKSVSEASFAKWLRESTNAQP